MDLPDARADFEYAPVGSGFVDEGAGSPVSSEELDRAGYVSQDQLSAWIETHLIPKLQLLTERMDGFELDLGAHKTHTEDRLAALDSRIGVCEEAMVHADPQPADGA